MRVRLPYVAGALLLHLVSGLVVPEDPAGELDKRIMNGFLMPQYFAPYVVSLLKKAGDVWYMCGGSIISDEHIVTAAHCVVDDDGFAMPPANVSIGYGSPNKDKQTSVTTTKVTIHPDYRISNNDRNDTLDIAVLQIPKLTFTNSTQRVPIYGGDIEPNQPLMASGWGGTEATAILKNMLRGVIVITGDQADCKKLNSGFETSNGPQVCTLGKLTPEHSTCGGDSGTSVVISQDGVEMLAGLDSIAVYPDGGDCGVSTSGHFYIHPYYHIGFITDSTGLTESYFVNSTSTADKDYDSVANHVESADEHSVVVVTKTVLQTPSNLPTY
ncbi:hypothetical protein LPJ59_000584 [Coemansia sp. RSA 2399]|nr:hypothetical protein LPJ59_000584 [Coemansia sp. RSA 2399]KAJ1907917.1 hypothetical protein LPJ81_000451 [Coemansia sp. IMI 209127]